MPRGLYIKVVRPRGQTYAQLARGIREGTKVRTEVLVNFGRVTPEQIENLRRWLATDPRFPLAPRPRDIADLSELSVRQSWSYGKVAIGHFLWRKLGLHQLALETLNGVPHKGRVAALLEAIVLNRLDDPTSKYGLLEWLPTTAVPFFLHLDPERLHDNLFYRAMDAFWRAKDRFEPKLFERVVRPMSQSSGVLYHDLTSSYFEGEGGPLAQFGYSRDRRADRPQVSWGMVVTPEGLPITLQVYPGNTTDNTTVIGMVDRLTRLFGLKEGTYVGDRGMKSEEVLADLHAHGFHYVLAEVNRNVEEIILQAQKLPPVAVSEQNQVREVIDREGRRFIVLLNEERRKTELENLGRRIAQGEAILYQLRRAWAKRPRHHHTILRQAHAALAAKGLSDLFEIEWDEATVRGLTAKLKEGRRRDRRLAGWWVLTTDTDLPPEEVARLYMGLSIIEQGWRELKSGLEVRPIRHRLERRIEAHLFLCVLAYLLERVVELHVRMRDYELTGAKALDQFRTIMLNEVELAKTGWRRRLVTEMTKEQRSLLGAIGVAGLLFDAGPRGLD